MKKLIYLLFIAGFLSMTSCGGSENKNESAARDSAAAAEAQSKADAMLKMSSDTTTKLSADTTKK